MNPPDKKDAKELAELVLDILINDVKPERRQQAQNKLLQVANIGFNTCKRMINEEIIKSIAGRFN